MNIGKKLREYLADMHISQTELSIMSGITLSKISLMLRGKRKLSLEEYEVICYCLNLPAGTFLEARKPKFLLDNARAAQ